MYGIAETIRKLLDAGVSNHNIRHLVDLSPPQLNKIITGIGYHDKLQGKGRPKLKAHKLTRLELLNLIKLQKIGVHFLDIAKILECDPNSILNFFFDARVKYGVACCIICSSPFVWLDVEGSRKCDSCRVKLKKTKSLF